MAAFQKIARAGDVWMHQMTKRFQELYNQALDALDGAPDGQWIAASEWAFRDAFVQLMKESYPAAMRSRVEAMCKALTLRLKCPGMKWDTDNAAALMNLTALRQSGQGDRSRQSRRIA